ncbi:hypothetical protein JMN32_05085 [Fulvivirga sp. 29W222]|uniref:Uncharacterized protein n=1 Tax=Fulvivirga marina TaxID=2494733 RepID=A0A937FWK5_9BACT|nr:hypothetical protein [Fulvivirga marina]MBL6445671.1 hypothetical protein [Fulvivirga marina]
MRLLPGIYKIKLRTLIEEFAVLRVYMKDGKKVYQVNNGPETDLDWLMDRDPCQVIKQIKQLQVQNARIDIKITDSDGDYFSFPASSVEVVRQIFQTFPDVGRALGAKVNQ